MATLDQRGFVNDGSSNLTVNGALVAPSTMQANSFFMTTNVLTGSNFCVIAAPGFYQVPVTGTSGQGAFTGSLPSAGLWPGGEILITDTLGIYPYMLTGSMAMMTGSVANVLASLNGTKLKVSAGGTVGFWSDSKGWLISAVSGTLTLT